MKKLLSLITSLILLLTCAAAVAKPAEIAPCDNAVHFEGYVVGDPNGSASNKWIGFTDLNPTEYDTYSFALDTYAAACYDGTAYAYVYGYDSDGTLHSDFYTIDLSTHIVTFPEGASSGGEFVYGMAYSYADNTMYALCNENSPYIASVNLSTGALTRVVNVNLGSNLGLQTFAIDAAGEFYALTFSAVNSKLVKINRTSGAMTVVKETNMPCFYAQSMTYDMTTNKIYWAHVDDQFSYDNGLYSIDLSNNYAVSYCGMIGGNFEIMGLYSVSGQVPPAPALTGDVNGDGVVDTADALIVLRYSMTIGDLTPAEQEAADVNHDGAVTTDDALLILRYALGMIAWYC